MTVTMSFLFQDVGKGGNQDVHHILHLLPTVTCHSPRQSLKILHEQVKTPGRHVLLLVTISMVINSGPGLVPGSWIMMRHVSCILLLEWSTTSQRLWVYRIPVPYAQKDPRFLFEKRRGQPREFRLSSQQ